MKATSFVKVLAALLAVGLVIEPRALQAKEPPSLSFDLTARAWQTPKAKGEQAISRSATARVLLRGERVRVESRLGEQRIVMLWIKPYAYRLLPSSKSGVRYKASTPVPEMQAFGASWPQMLQNPAKIRAGLRTKGARLVRKTRLGSVTAEEYSASRWAGTPRRIRIWLRSDNALPIKMETQQNGFNLTLNWRNFKRNPRLSAGLFKVPASYRIRDGKAPAAM